MVGVSVMVGVGVSVGVRVSVGVLVSVGVCVLVGLGKSVDVGGTRVDVEVAVAAGANICGVQALSASVMRMRILAGKWRFIMSL